MFHCHKYLFKYGKKFFQIDYFDFPREKGYPCFYLPSQKWLFRWLKFFHFFVGKFFSRSWTLIWGRRYLGAYYPSEPKQTPYLGSYISNRGAMPLDPLNKHQGLKFSPLVLIFACVSFFAFVNIRTCCHLNFVLSYLYHSNFHIVCVCIYITIEILKIT